MTQIAARMRAAWPVALLLGASAGLAACGGGTGVCTACCGPSGQTYCKDDWTKDECKDWSDQRVNGLAWTFHKNQTCAERGTPETP